MVNLMLGGFHFNFKKYGQLSIRSRERRQRQVSGEPQVRKQVSCHPCPGGPAERVSPAAKNGKLRQNNEVVFFCLSNWDPFFTNNTQPWHEYRERAFSYSSGGI